MTNRVAELTREVLALPPEDRANIAEQIWDSLDERSSAPSAQNDARARELAKQRNAELISGADPGRTHEQIMDAMRKALE